ncbi:hypothetical protein Y032_1063g3519 [Ancylostoma ceylanicum]|uniref:Pyridoxal-dependent decarboxylase domain protein n=1 Tax=Ancylostoma ceylanicum TaxID=53326 RepID=A0A016W8R1_9BILA|nr:hypothetical protein Y032_1063g3519 [Ancylostoma ceylanicum]
MHTSSHPMWRVVFEHVDEARALVNRQCSHLESWQIMSYTIAMCFLVMWFRRMNRSDKPFIHRMRSSVYSIIRSLPWVKRRVKADLERARKEIEEEVHQCDQKRDFYKFLPEHPLAGEELLSEARQYAAMGERRYMEHYDPRTRNQDLSLCAKIYDLFSHSDPHRSDAFPGARKMEAEILRMSLSMFHGGAEACGVVAGGGTEVTLLACLVMFRHVKFSQWPTVVFTTAGMNEINPDSIKGKKWVGFLYNAEKETGGRGGLRMTGEQALPQ